MIALDYSDPVAARHLVSHFTAGSVIWKIGSELFLAAGPEFVKEMTRARQRVFLDLKFNAITGRFVLWIVVAQGCGKIECDELLSG